MRKLLISINLGGKVFKQKALPPFRLVEIVCGWCRFVSGMNVKV